MIANLDKLKYSTMTPIQETCIPLVLKKHDILAQAKTGSGKTAAFGIGLLENLKSENFIVQSLILCPTRELSDQVADELRRLAKFKHNIKVLSITGGLPMSKQELSLKHRAHIIVGTPGRVLKHLEKGSLKLDSVTTFVLDEADRMLDMGFIDQIEGIMRDLPAIHQSLCFSATFSDEIRELCSDMLVSPKEIKIDTHHDEGVIAQYFYPVQPTDKAMVIAGILGEHSPESTVIFCNMKDGVRRLSTELGRLGVQCLALHGDLEQKDRTEVLIRFSNRSCRVLIATDVAARGLDISDLETVINYDMPLDVETYVHRAGRTGRAGKEGSVYTLGKPGQRHRIDGLNEYFGSSFTFEEAREWDSSNCAAATMPEMVTLSINGGRKNKISAGDLLGALTAGGKIPGNAIGKIDRLDYITFVAVKRAYSGAGIELLEQHRIKGRRFKAMLHKN